MTENISTPGLDLALTEDLTAEVERLAVKCMEEGVPLATVKGINNEELDAFYAVGYNLYQQKKLDEARKVFQFLALHQHLDCRFWLGLGGCYQRMGDYKNAINAYTVAALVDATNPLYSSHACECYIAQQDWPMAEKALEASRTLVDMNLEDQDQSELMQHLGTLSSAIEAGKSSQRGERAKGANKK